MRALITGASSGMGRDMARVLSCMGWELFLVARINFLKSSKSLATKQFVFVVIFPKKKNVESFMRFSRIKK